MSNLPFLLLILLFIAIAPSVELLPPSFEPFDGLLWGILIYLLTLLLIAIQSFSLRSLKYQQPTRALKLASLELSLSLFLFCFVFGSLRMVEPSATLQMLLPLSLYFAGLAFFYVLIPPIETTLRSEIYFLLPFALPLFCLNLLSDLITLYDFEFQEQTLEPYALFFMLCALVAFFGMLMFLMPYAIQALWQCRSLEGPVRLRLEALCLKANFSYRDLMTWGVMDHALTAAIIGICPRFRYVLFTKRLVSEMSPECVEAILCHEIGHHKHKHLLIYPFIIAGMGLVIVLFTGFYEKISLWLEKNSIHPSTFEWQSLTFLWFFFCYIAIPLLYLRYLFGFFSRLFERQADLYIFKLKVNSSTMVEALDYIGRVTGTLRQPNWHHYATQKRIDFVMAADANRNLIAMHDRFVHTMLYLYFFSFFGLLWYLFSTV